MSPQVFKVLTEFKFEVGSAIVQSDQMTGAIENLSAKAKEAQYAVQGLGFTLLSDLGGGLTSFVGFLRAATIASENFTKAQLGIAQILSANAQNFKTNFNTSDFNAQKQFAASVIKDISDQAIKFGLDQQSLFETSKLVSGLLAPKGLTGKNFGTSIELSRNLLKASPALGLNPTDVQGQLLRSIEGSASMGDTFFVRLAAETQIFQDKFKNAAHVAKEFNKLPIAERLKMINTGLNQFANNAEVLSGFQNLISNQLRTIRDLFIGIRSVLVPLGEIISVIIKDALAKFIEIMDTSVRKTIENVASVMKMFATDAKGLYVNLQQVQSLSSDFKTSGLITLILAALPFIIKFIGTTRVLIGALVLLGAVFIPVVGGFAGLIFLLFRFFGVIKYVVSGVIAFKLAMLPLLVLFQTLSRAFAIAKADDALMLPAVMEKVSAQLKKMSVVFEMVFGPALKFFDSIAKDIAPILQWAFWIDKAIGLIEFLTDSLVVFFAVIRGLVFNFASAYQALMSGDFKEFFTGRLSSFEEGVNSFYEEFFKKTSDPTTGEQLTASNVTNINKVEIRNDFKDKLEPDRIAFTIKDQLLKAAQNPVAARGKAFSVGATGAR